MTGVVQLPLWTTCPKCGMVYDAHRHRAEYPAETPAAQVAILDLLRNETGPRTGLWLADRVGWSKSAVYRHLKELVNEEYIIDCGRQGYKLPQKVRLSLAS